MISKSEASDMSETAVTKEITTMTATGTVTTVYMTIFYVSGGCDQ